MTETLLRTPPTPAKQRLLDAGARIFAAHGFDGATTREIAHDAGVNEVTLFRHFQSKENLHAAVLEHVFHEQAVLLAAQPRPAFPAGLRADLRRIGQNYLHALTQNLSLVRTLLGEIHRHREHEKQVLHGVFDPLKAELLATLEAARRANLLRPDIDPQLAVSMLPGMILADTLRRSIDPCARAPYAAEEHLSACIEVFIRGIIADPSLA